MPSRHGSQERERERSPSYRHERSSRQRSRSRDRYYSRHDSPRRRSPYRRSGRRHSSEFDHSRDGGRRSQGESYFMARNRERESNPITIWAHSPEPRSRRSPTPEPGKRRQYSESSDDSLDQSDDSRERERKSKRKHKHSKRSSHKKRRARSRSLSPSTDRNNHRSHARERSVSTGPLPNLDDNVLAISNDTLWVEKNVDIPSDLVPVGPQPLPAEDRPDEREYGGQLLPGEGSAMAAYVQQGKRIPRRGEIGLSGDQISDYEKAGFVMSGSRHQRMNAVRLRKENQVISAEEKRQLLQHAREEKLKRQNEIISEFREMVNDKLKQHETEPEQQ